MNRMYRVGVAALALAAVVSQTTVANAGIRWCPPKVEAAAGGSFPIFLVVGAIVCTGLTWGKLEVQANGRELTAKERLHAALHCAFPPLGFAKLIRNG